jgi:hypothetical protein
MRDFTTREQFEEAYRWLARYYDVAARVHDVSGLGYTDGNTPKSVQTAPFLQNKNAVNPLD